MKKIISILSIIFCLNSTNVYADGWLTNGLGGYYYVGSTSPTSTENDVETLFDTYSLNITDFRSQFYWFDTSSNQIYDYVDGSNGSFQWLQRGYTAPSKVFSVTTPTLNSASLISSTRDCLVSYSVDIQISSLLLGSASGSVYLEYADDSGFTTNVVTIMQGNNVTSGVLNLVNKNTVTLTGIIPAAKYHRIRTVTNSGTVAFTSLQGQQVLL